MTMGAPAATSPRSTPTKNRKNPSTRVTSTSRNRLNVEAMPITITGTHTAPATKQARRRTFAVPAKSAVPTALVRKNSPNGMPMGSERTCRRTTRIIGVPMASRMPRRRASRPGSWIVSPASFTSGKPTRFVRGGRTLCAPIPGSLTLCCYLTAIYVPNSRLAELASTPTTRG